MQPKVVFTKIENQFWLDPTVRAKSADLRYLMLYLLTSPHRNIIGFYHMPKPYAAYDMSWDEERFGERFRELLANGWAKYDDNGSVILVKNYLRHNPLDNPNQVTGAIKALNELPETPLFADFMDLLKALDKPLLEPLVKRLGERLGKPVISNQYTVISNQYIPPTPQTETEVATTDEPDAQAEALVLLLRNKFPLQNAAKAKGAARAYAEFHAGLQAGYAFDEYKAVIESCAEPDLAPWDATRLVKEKRKETPEHPETQRFLDAFATAFKDTVKADPLFTKTDREKASDLVSRYTEDQLADMIVVFFRQPDAYIEQHGFSVGLFYSRVNQMLKQVGGS